RLMEWQTNNIGIGADEFDDKAAGDALHRIATRLATPFAGREIGLDVVRRESLEAHASLNQALTETFLRRDQTNTGINPMIAAREQTQTLRRLVQHIGLWQDSSPNRDNGIGRKDIGAAQFFIETYRRERGLGLRAGQSGGAGAWQFALARHLVN